MTGWRIQDLEIDDKGVLWAATARGLAFNADGLWYGGQGGEARDVEFGPDGAAYYLASGASVWRYAGDGWQELPPPREAQVLNAMVLHVADDGAVWIGTHQGAYRYDGQAWRQFTAQDGLPANDVAAIAGDAAGWLWFGTEQGAARVDPATLDLSPVVWPAAAAPSPPSQLSPTPAPTPQVTPTPCALPPADPFAAAYAAGEVALQLGCPTRGPVAANAAFQPFEQGLMFWRADERTIYVLHADSAWAHYIDTYADAEPESAPALQPPKGLLQPVRGFGKLWRQQLGGPQSDLGWALAEERGYMILTQPFTGGQIFLGPNGEVYILYATGTWETSE